MLCDWTPNVTGLISLSLARVVKLAVEPLTTRTDVVSSLHVIYTLQVSSLLLSLASTLTATLPHVSYIFSLFSLILFNTQLYIYSHYIMRRIIS